MGCQLAQTACYLFSYNLAAVAVIQQRLTRDPFLLHLLWCLYFYAAHFKFTYVTCHASGLSNVAEDALSRDYIAAVEQGGRGATASPIICLGGLAPPKMICR